MKEEIKDDEWSMYQEDIRLNIDTAQYVFNFLEEVDPDSPEVLRWNMKRQVLKAKKAALKIICEGIHLLEFTPDTDEED